MRTVAIVTGLLLSVSAPMQASEPIPDQVSEAWTQITTPGAGPARSGGHSLVYDPLRHRLLFFGGQDCKLLFNEVWELPLTAPHTWTRLSPTGAAPMVRKEHSAIYDPVRDRMIVFGGHPPTGALNDVWALNLAGTPSWESLSPTGDKPPPRQSHAAIYDPLRDRMVIFGGRDSDNCTLNDTWALTLDATPSWTRLVPVGASPSHRTTPAVYDPIGDRMIIFAGASIPSCQAPGVVVGGLWELRFSEPVAWSELLPVGASPDPRFLHGVIYDPVRQGMVLTGGVSDQAHYDTWFLNPSGSPSWAQPFSPGPSWPDSYGSYVYHPVYDSFDDQMIALLRTGSCGQIDTVSLDAWRLPLPPPEQFCGDGVNDPGEECDGVDNAACPEQCLASCVCSTLVNVASFTAHVVRHDVRLAWTTTDEIPDTSFRILRARDGEEPVIITPQLIPAQGSVGSGADYEFVDTERQRPGTAIYYLEEIDLYDRTRRATDIVSVEVTRPFTTGLRKSRARGGRGRHD